VYICPEGTRSRDSKIKKFNSLAFKIANDMKMPIFPVVIYYSRPIMSKNLSSFAFCKKVEIKIHVLEAIIPQENETTAKLLTETQNLMETELEKMSR
jgi:1-acyl-sn-glycerol-3-phosphate acyltransferase